MSTSTTIEAQQVFLLVVLAICITPSASSTDTFVFGGCSQKKYAPSSPYQSNLNSVLSSIINAAMFTTFNNFTFKGMSSSSQDTIYALFQCRGDLSVSECGKCVSRAVSEVGSLCPSACGGALQLDGCCVKYDNVRFLGVEDKTVVVKKCGPLILNNPDALTRRDAALDFISGGDGGAYKQGGYYRVGRTGDVSGVAQCVQDLSVGECQDCLTDAIGLLKTDCATAATGDVYLAKCYARYLVNLNGVNSQGQPDDHNNNNNNSGNGEETEKTLAILIGLVAGVALLILFLSYLRKACGKEKGCK